MARCTFAAPTVPITRRRRSCPDRCRASPDGKTVYFAAYDELGAPTIYRVAAEACDVAAFPIRRPPTHGWMHELAFAPGQFEALAARCGEVEPCEVTIEGVLAKLEAYDDAPTRLRFEQVTVLL